MSRLIVISNRVSLPGDEGGATSGGLAMALAAAVRRNSGVWFGWSGRTVADGAYSGQLSVRRTGGVTVATIDLEEQDRLQYYNGYANKTLWPLLHYRLDLAAFERSFNEGYARVNARFADAVRPLIEPTDIVWVHDYHLIPLARELRKLGVVNRIGFFLHVPWPARRVVAALPGHRDLVEALFQYDLVGFQTADSRDAFAGYLSQELKIETPASGHVEAFGHRTQIGAFPIGLDAKAFAQAVESKPAQAMRQRMIDSLGGRRMIVGVDRLDYSKGLEERFSAYEQLLIDHPAFREQIFLLQVATPTRDEVEAYQDIRARLEAISGRINGAFATVDWVPIRYVNSSLRRDELAGLYRAAAVGLVTPLRDGMNLVAKEYVAAQDPADPGVLILSEFAGAAEQLREALIVNPLSREGVSEAIQRALTMPLPERRRRWQALFERVTKDDVTAWRDGFVTALRGDAGSGPGRAPGRTLLAVPSAGHLKMET